jgi:hypothetical protein
MESENKKMLNNPQKRDSRQSSRPSHAAHAFGCAAILLSTAMIAPARSQAAPGRGARSEPEGSMSDVIHDSAVRWDANHDGIYTCDEWKAFVEHLFDIADKKRKAWITPAEFESIRNADPVFSHAEFGYFDQNGDGRVSRLEFVNAPSPFFARYDPKNTCKVSLTDLAPKPSPETGGRGHGGGRRGF